MCPNLFAYQPLNRPFVWRIRRCGGKAHMPGGFSARRETGRAKRFACSGLVKIHGVGCRVRRARLLLLLWKTAENGSCARRPRHVRPSVGTTQVGMPTAGYDWCGVVGQPRGRCLRFYSGGEPDRTLDALDITCFAWNCLLADWDGPFSSCPIRRWLLPSLREM